MIQITFQTFKIVALFVAIILILLGFFLNEQYNDWKSLFMNIGSGILTTLIFIVCYDEVNSNEKKKLELKYKRVAMISLKNILLGHLEFLCCLSGKDFFSSIINNSNDFNDFFTDEYYSIVDEVDLGKSISQPFNNSAQYKYIHIRSGKEYICMQNKETLKRLERLVYRYGAYIPADIIEEYEKITVSMYIKYEPLYNLSKSEFIKEDTRKEELINNVKPELKVDESLCITYASTWKLSSVLRDHVESILHILNEYNENVSEKDKINLINIENEILWIPILP